MTLTLKTRPPAVVRVVPKYSRASSPRPNGAGRTPLARRSRFRGRRRRVNVDRWEAGRGTKGRPPPARGGLKVIHAAGATDPASDTARGRHKKLPSACLAGACVPFRRRSAGAVQVERVMRNRDPAHPFRPPSVAPSGRCRFVPYPAVIGNQNARPGFAEGAAPPMLLCSAIVPP